jgi:hypothetical protein
MDDDDPAAWARSFSADDLLALAAQLGARVAWGSPPRTVFVGGQAWIVAVRDRDLAHELGHLVVRRFRLRPADEEAWAESFGCTLLRTKNERRAQELGPPNIRTDHLSGC